MLKKTGWWPRSACLFHFDTSDVVVYPSRRICDKRHNSFGSEHAANETSIEFKHPVTGKSLKFEAPVTDDFRTAWERVTKSN